MRSTPAARPAAPAAPWKTIEIVAAGNWRWVTWRSVSRSWFVRTGWDISSRFACDGPCSRRLPPAPRVVTRDITACSRIGSMGGLVTWAKSCLK